MKEGVNKKDLVIPPKAQVPKPLFCVSIAKDINNIGIY